MVELNLAIENIWMIDSHSGICIYDWCTETKEKTIDEQLVSGLLLAFRNFSSEAGLVDISAIEGIDRKLAYKADDRFIIASICHSKDYEPLVDETLLGLLKDFRKKYKHLLDEGATTDVSPFRTFDENITNKLEGTTASRNIISLSVGAIITAALIGAMFAVYFFTITPIRNALPESGGLLGLMILLVGFIIGGFFGGLVAGERRFGMIASFISVLPITGFFIAFFRVDWDTMSKMIINSALFFLLFSVMAISGGLLGGYLKERKFLYPVNIDEEITE